MRKILFVDDNRVNVALYQNVVAKLEDVMPICYTDPRAALAWCRSELPALLVVDYHMPEIDGLQFIRRFRDIPGSEALPVVMLTSTHDPTLWQMALSAGANEFLMKPIEKAQFVATLNRLTLDPAAKQAPSKG